MIFDYKDIREQVKMSGIRQTNPYSLEALFEKLNAIYHTTNLTIQGEFILPAPYYRKIGAIEEWFNLEEEFKSKFNELKFKYKSKVETDLKDLEHINSSRLREYNEKHSEIIRQETAGLSPFCGDYAYWANMERAEEIANNKVKPPKLKYTGNHKELLELFKFDADLEIEHYNVYCFIYGEEVRYSPVTPLFLKEAHRIMSSRPDELIIKPIFKEKYEKAQELLRKIGV